VTLQAHKPVSPADPNGGGAAEGFPWTPLSTAVALAGGVALAFWLSSAGAVPVEPRLPTERPRAVPTAGNLPSNPGSLVRGTGRPLNTTGSWPQFRGPDRSGIAPSTEKLAREWPTGGPPVLWSVNMGEGYAGAAIHKGSVYVIDYDAARQEDAIRRLSMRDGAEIWRYTYTARVKRSHGMSRTVPAVTDRFVVTMGPLCHVVCLDADSGELLWKKNLVEEHGSQVPPWYAGQCPLVDDGRVILAPGANPLLMAVEALTGQTLWQTPNPGGWGMTHCSVSAVEWEGGRQLIYSATTGTAGVASADGRLLWKTTDWQVPVAAIASPVSLGAGRLLFSGGYGIGAAVFQLRAAGAGMEVSETLRLKPAALGATQHTPIFYKGHIYAVIPSGEMVCLAPDGARLWSSGPNARFELGPFLIADGVILALDGAKGVLRMMEATPEACRVLAEARVLDGHEAWAPMALADGRLIVRDLTRMVCLWVGKGDKP